VLPLALTSPLPSTNTNAFLNIACSLHPLP
jgi:hypothetical protein